MESQTQPISIDIPAEFTYFPSKDTKRLVLLLHGYMENNKLMNSRLKSFGDSTSILCPNGPFPIPQGSPTKSISYPNQFSWYFYNPNLNNFYISYTVAQEFVKKLIFQLKLQHLPTTIIGYSQGGYLGLLLADILPQVDHFIGVSCSYRHDLLRHKPHYRVDAIHAENDEIVDINEARDYYTKLSPEGEFITLPNQTHKFTPLFSDKVQDVFKNFQNQQV